MPNPNPSPETRFGAERGLDPVEAGHRARGVPKRKSIFQLVVSKLEDATRGDEVAEAYLKKLVEGDMSAFRMLFERTDPTSAALTANIAVQRTILMGKEDTLEHAPELPEPETEPDGE